MPHSEHSRRQQSLSWSRNSPPEYIALPNILLLLRRGIVTPQSNHQAGGPSFVGCPRLLIHHIRCYPQLCGGISLDPQPQGASHHRGDTVARRNIAIQLTAYISSQVITRAERSEKFACHMSEALYVAMHLVSLPSLPATCRLNAHSCRTPADHTTQPRGVSRSVPLADWQARRVPLHAAHVSGHSSALRNPKVHYRVRKGPPPICPEPYESNLHLHTLFPWDQFYT
jgi:hypothetical protein